MRNCKNRRYCMRERVPDGDAEVFFGRLGAAIYIVTLTSMNVLCVRVSFVAFGAVSFSL